MKRSVGQAVSTTQQLHTWGYSPRESFNLSRQESWRSQYDPNGLTNLSHDINILEKLMSETVTAEY